MRFTSKTLAVTVAVMTASLELAHAVSCPGVVQSNEDSKESVCCVGADINFGDDDCDNWPMCTGSNTANTAASTTSCATIIPVTASNYDELVQSASSKYLGGNSNSKGTTITADISLTTATGSSSGSPGQTSTTSITTTTGNDSGAGKLGLGYAVAIAVVGGAVLL